MKKEEMRWRRALCAVAIHQPASEDGKAIYVAIEASVFFAPIEEKARLKKRRGPSEWDQ
jgi:hypothetical protein